MLPNGLEHALSVLTTLEEEYIAVKRPVPTPEAGLPASRDNALDWYAKSYANTEIPEDAFRSGNMEVILNKENRSIKRSVDLSQEISDYAVLVPKASSEADAHLTASSSYPPTSLAGPFPTTIEKHFTRAIQSVSPPQTIPGDIDLEIYVELISLLINGVRDKSGMDVALEELDELPSRQRGVLLAQLIHRMHAIQYDFKKHQASWQALHHAIRKCSQADQISPLLALAEKVSHPYHIRILSYDCITSFGLDERCTILTALYNGIAQEFENAQDAMNDLWRAVLSLPPRYRATLDPVISAAEERLHLDYVLTER